MSSWFQRNRHRYPPEWDTIAKTVKARAVWTCECCGAVHGRPPKVLTVDHLDFDPGNNYNEDGTINYENLMALCQRCHLKRQGLIPPPMTRDQVLKRLLPAGEQLKLGIA